MTNEQLDEIQNAANHGLERFFIKIAQLESEYLCQEDDIRCPGMTQYIIGAIHHEIIVLKGLRDAIEFACELRGRLRKKDEA